MRQFDYARAWQEVARPAFETLPQDVRDLYVWTCEVASGLSQGPDFGMPWPEDVPEFRTTFRHVPTEYLSLASRAIYFYGHWSPRGDSKAGSGGTWKFSNYADRELRERLGHFYNADRRPIPRESNGGVSLRIHEGAIRACFASEWEWTWYELDAATREGIERLRAQVAVRALTPSDAKRRSRRAWDEAGDSFRELCATYKAATPLPAPWADFLNTDRFMTETEAAR